MPTDPQTSAKKAPQPRVPDATETAPSAPVVADEPRFSTARLLKEGNVITGCEIWEIAGALAGQPDNEYTIAEIKDLVEANRSRVIDVDPAL